MEGFVLFAIGLVVLVNAHKFIGKFALVLHFSVFLIAVIAVAQRLEINPHVLLLSLLGIAVAGFLALALWGYLNQRK